MNGLRHLRAIARAFCQNARAAAAVEFALILPLLVLIVLGGAGANSYLAAASRVDQAVRTLGDLFSGTTTNLRNITVLDYMGWGREVARVGRRDRLMQGVAFYLLNPTGPPAMLWAKADWGLPHIVPNLDAYRRTSGSVYMLVVTARYIHQGPVNLPPFSGITIDRVQAFPSRFGRIFLVR